MFYPLSHIIQVKNKDYRFLLVLAIGFRVDVYRGGIMDKTLMCESASRMDWHDFSIWVLYSCQLLEIVRQKVLCGFLQKRFKINRIIIIPIRVFFSVERVSFKGIFLDQGAPLLCFSKDQLRISG